MYIVITYKHRYKNNKKIDYHYEKLNKTTWLIVGRKILTYTSYSVILHTYVKYNNVS